MFRKGKECRQECRQLLTALGCGFLAKKLGFLAAGGAKISRALQKCEKTVISKQRLLANQSDTWPFLPVSR